MKARRLRLTCSDFWVNVRLVQIDGKWLASADTRDGASIGCGRLPEEALVHALAPFGAMVDELMRAVPDELYWARPDDAG